MDRRAGAELSRELRRLNRSLHRLARGQTPPRREISGASLRAVLAARRQRDLCFTPPIGDHSWTILIEAYAAHLEGRQMPMTGFGAVAGIARSTAHRRVTHLLDRGLLTSHADPADDRIVLIDLPDDTAARIRAYLVAGLDLGLLL